MLTSDELAVIFRFPREEMPGYNLYPTIKFGASVPREIVDNSNKETENKKVKTISIGKVRDRGTYTGELLCIDTDSLTKHALIAGVTGSGKTNTCFHLLKTLWNDQKVPFLIIEPTKSEYRELIKDIPEIQLFTPGNESVAPFRLNPFEVPPKVRVQTHLDNLRAVFNASFTMYAPAPYVLEQAILRVYEINGWDIASNIKGKTPTLENLYDQIGEIVGGLGYDKEISMNVQSRFANHDLKSSFRGKGKMFNCSSNLHSPLKL